MKIRENSHCHDHWMRKPILAKSYQHWLIDHGSLTLRLQQLNPNFQVTPLSSNYGKPLGDEAAVLSLKPYQSALIRKVVLMSNKQPVVFAHSVLPCASLRGEWRSLSRLGNKPLGATLFINPKVRRTPLTFKKLSRQHALYKQAIKHIVKPPGYLWARRSVFSLNGVNILVTEIFLPQLLIK